MKQSIRYYGPVALVLTVILILSVGLTLLTAPAGPVEDRPRVVATVYPLYAAARYVIGDTDGVALDRLSGTASGCLHDYQLSPADRLAVERADLLLLNGGGAEAFLGELTAGKPVVDTGEEVSFLCNSHHHEEPHHDHAHEDGVNEHIWTSPTRYAQQVEAVVAALCRLDPANATAYRANGATYGAAIAAVAEGLPKLTGRRCVIFHDSLAYLAQDLGLEVALTLNAGEESGLSAGDLAVVQSLAVADPTLLLLYDSQYPMRYSGVDGLVPAAQVLVLETGVTGAGNPTDWLDAMARNAKKLEAAVSRG